MDFSIIQQIGAKSDKVLFYYDFEEHQFSYLSPATANVFGSLEQTLHNAPRHLLTYINTDDKLAAASRVEKLKNGCVVDIKFSLRLPNGAEKDIKVEAYPITNGEGLVTAAAGFAEDISLQMQHHNYLIDFGNRKDSLLEIIAHDLRGPLSTVQSVTNLLESEHQEKKYGEVSKYTRIIEDACHNCIALIAELLQQEHQQSPTVFVRKERTDVLAQLRKMVEQFQVSNKNLYFELIADEEQVIAELDEIKFVQIMNNLFANSIKFTAPGGKIMTSVKRDDDKLYIAHSDTGIGIPKEQQPTIFMRRNKPGRTGLRGEPTNGVGMYIVRELVELQGGSISLESEEHKGTTFYLSFPLWQQQ